ncbi:MULTISPECIES: ribosome assembly cofactor RimP [unclassified Lentimicrobium]|uniref:ribosome assembly cofactor RimP n=1 Tax=unclassified Lentimicrobium TaxID=2677434 RepID=UPI0015529567|nr:MULTISPECIES: ribosome assembly cofactor RimP [unclassified Lentimicrobium]
MIGKKKIEALIEEGLSGTDRFLVELNINEANHIEVFIDSDTRVGIDHCVELSRQIESNLDREEEDFFLNVSSAGLDLPLRKKRQYLKHVGQLLKIKLTDGSQILIRVEEVKEDGILGTPLKKNPNAKKGSRKPYHEEEPLIIEFNSIQESKIEVVF